MTEIYRKRGAAARWEHGMVVLSTECGMATEERDLFQCAPDDGERPPRIDPGGVIAAAEQVVGKVPPAIRIERLIVTEGAAEHRFTSGTADVRWNETSRRIHLSLTAGRQRVLIDLGSFELDEIDGITGALMRCDGMERDAPPRLRLAPAVTAALIPSLIGLAPHNLALVQTGGGRDGKGQPVVEQRIERPPWPNWYRPTYRFRPELHPLNLHLQSEVTEIDCSRPIAVALLAPVDGLSMRVLVDDGVRAWPATVRITRIDAVAEPSRWYPYGAGSFGAEMML